MLDFAESLENRNFGMGKTGGVRILREASGIILSLLVIAGAFSFHVWVRCQILELGYQKQQLDSLADRLKQIQQQLILEEQTLKNPAVVELFARQHLQLQLIKPSQILPTSLRGGVENSEQSLISRSAFTPVHQKAHLSPIVAE